MPHDTIGVAIEFVEKLDTEDVFEIRLTRRMNDG